MVESGIVGSTAETQGSGKACRTPLSQPISPTACCSRTFIGAFRGPFYHQSDRKGRSWHNSKLSITITGYVGANPTQFNKDGMPHASSFRMASTRRYFDNRTQQWKDLPTTWITVKAYRNLSENICQSLKKGEPVIVVGSLATETWTDMNGKPQSRIVLEASAAGHDLNRGVTTLRKFIKPNDQSQPETKSTEPQVGVDPFARHDSAAPVEIVVPEDDEAAEFSGNPEEFGGDIY